MTELHSTTDLVLEAIRAFWAENDFSPSIRDIGEATGISSTSVVRYHIDRLERAGVIKRTPRRARSYIPIEGRASKMNCPRCDKPMMGEEKSFDIKDFEGKVTEKIEYTTWTCPNCGWHVSAE